MNETSRNEISTESYKGVRDFYPEEMYVQKYMFDTMRLAVEKFGYVEYGASILESTDLYKAKSGEEIVNKQTYSFKDRGDRDVTLRPEMTPTVARMVAAKKRDLAFPLRWYSIPNLFRYENPQRGRLREHFQLNVDLFGVTNTEAEKEVIAVAYEIMRSFGAQSTDFEVRISSRKILNYVFEQVLALDDTNTHSLTKLLDRKNKISIEDFNKEVSVILGESTEGFIELFGKRNTKEFKQVINDRFQSIAFGLDELDTMIDELKAVGIDNVLFDPTLTRGFDYYTGIVFEIYDTNSSNQRSLFGGGRYDDLLSIFGTERVPAVGFGMGDVTLQDFLAVRNLIPEYIPSAELYIAHADGATQKDIDVLASSLRNKGLKIAVDITDKKLGDQIKKASKDKIPFSIVIGESEIASKQYKLKNMKTEQTTTVNEEDLIKHIIESR